MTATFHDWQAPGDECSGGPRPGTVALLAALLDTFGESYSLGIYNCRTVRGSTSPSVHGEGRALDLGIPMDEDGTGSEYGHEVVDRLRAAAWELGLTFMVYDRAKWGARYPDGADYGGVHPHYDHIHVEQTVFHAEFLTYATAMSLLKEPSVARTYAQAVVGYSDVDIENGRPIGAGYNLAMVRIAEDGTLHSVTHPGERAEVTDWAAVIGAKARDLYGSRTPRSVLAGDTRDATSKLVFRFIRDHNPKSWRRRGLPF